MVITIRTSKRRFYDEEGDELSGQCSFPTPSRMAIRISRPLNRTINAYAGTALHELIHAWVNLLERKGFKPPSDEKEEQFVRFVEQTVVKKFNRTFKRRK